MSDGISALRGKKAQRAARHAPPPRHPMSAGVVREFDQRDDNSANADTGGSEQPNADTGGSEQPNADTGGSEQPNADTGGSEQPNADTGGSDTGHAPPDLNIDWTDPLMHVASPTRVSVANSVAMRFKAVADQPGKAPQTELIMEAVSRHLPNLPELVLKRRPEERSLAPAGFFVRRAPVQKAEPWQPVYMRPIAGEVEALGRIVNWVNGIILTGHPGRQKTSRSEVVTAALDAAYPGT
jgi:hypothetical protein